MGGNTYEIAPGLVWFSRAAGYGFLAAALATAAYGSLHSEEFPVWLTAICVAEFGGFAYLGLVCVRPAGYYTLELSHEGIRQLGSDRYVPWNSITHLRERLHLQRVDLECLNGSSGVSIEYQMKDFSEIMHQVLANVRCLDSMTTRAFVARTSRIQSATLALAVPMLMALALWGVFNGQWGGLILLIGLPLAFIYDRYTRIHSVTVSDDRVTLVRGLRTQDVPIKSVRKVELCLKPAGQTSVLDVIAELNGGERIRLRPAGVDAFELYASISRARGAA